MSNYVMSDLHGCYDEYISMIEEKIRLSDGDMLYILGDVMDRGPKPIKILLDAMKRQNVVLLCGNHEVMAIECLRDWGKEITEEAISQIDNDKIEKLENWLENGGQTTISEFNKCNSSEREAVLDYLYNSELFEELEINEKSFLLVHAGLDNFSPERDIYDYNLHELIWARPNFSVPYFEDKIVILGHTPTIELNNGYIYNKNNLIDIDCGISYSGGRLACLRLEDMKEFYVEKGRK